MAKNKLFVKDAELAKLQVAAWDHVERLNASEEKLKAAETEAKADKKRTHDNLAACVGDIKKAVSRFHNMNKCARKS